MPPKRKVKKVVEQLLGILRVHHARLKREFVLLRSGQRDRVRSRAETLPQVLNKAEASLGRELLDVDSWRTYSLMIRPPDKVSTLFFLMANGPAAHRRAFSESGGATR